MGQGPKIINLLPIGYLISSGCGRFLRLADSCYCYRIGHSVVRTARSALVRSPFAEPESPFIPTCLLLKWVYKMLGNGRVSLASAFRRTCSLHYGESPLLWELSAEHLHRTKILPHSELILTDLFKPLCVRPSGQTISHCFSIVPHATSPSRKNETHYVPCFHVHWQNELLYLTLAPFQLRF